MTTQEERKRKLLLFLPLLLLPFLALGFYALGGGRTDEQLRETTASKGINTELPGAKLKNDNSQDKLSLMDKAQRDSASARSKTTAGAFAALGWDTARFNRQHGSPAKTAEDNEAQIKDRLAQINKQINQPVAFPKSPNNDYMASAKSADLDRLERLLKQKQQGSEPDPQMQQLSGMLDKIMQIQNPALAKAKEKPVLNKQDSAFKAIPAIIDGNQKVPPGGIVKLRLKDTITINGILYPKGQQLSGLCAVTNQRLLLDIKNIRLGTTITPVNLTVFSLDGLQGINAPEAELAGAAGDGANGALENMQFLSADYSLSTQAATAGISAAKSLLGKKVKRIRVKLKGGETVLLRINK